MPFHYPSSNKHFSFKKLENENKELNQQNEHYKRELSPLKDECKTLQDAQDDLEQYTTCMWRQ